MLAQVKSSFSSATVQSETVYGLSIYICLFQDAINTDVLIRPLSYFSHNKNKNKSNAGVLIRSLDEIG